MIEANISSYIGVDSEAEHYYCHYREVEYENPKKYGSVGYGSEELFREITDPKEVIKLNKKDRYCGIKLGSKTNRFNSFQEIHNELLKLFPNNNIVTYEDNQPFKEMLCYINGVDLSYKCLGELWLNVPNSCFGDLLPVDENIIVKCLSCNKKHPIENIIEDRFYHTIEKREIVNFTTRGYEMTDRCCKYPDLVWNILL